MRRAALVAALLLSACAAATVSPPPSAHVPDGEGIALVGSPLRIDFGRAQDGVVAAVTRLEGRGPAAAVPCPGGVTAVRWQSGLSLQFRDGAFLGWAQSDGSAAGIGCSA